MAYVKRTVEIESAIVELYGAGKSQRATARALGVSRDTVCAVLDEHGLPVRSNHGFKIDHISAGLIQCSSCRRIKEDKYFQHGGGYTRLASFCNQCYQDRRKQSRDLSLSRYLGYRITQLKNEVKNKKQCPFNISKEHIEALWVAQGGLCFYTDQPLETSSTLGRHRHRLSIDRIVPNRGYVEGNVVLCTNKANIVKNDLTLEEIKAWLPGWHERIERFQQ